MPSETHDTDKQASAGTNLTPDEAKQSAALLREFVGTNGDDVNFEDVNLEDEVSAESYDALLAKLDAIADGE